MNTQSHAAEISGDRVLRDMLADARDNHPNRAWRESIMAAAFRVRWSMAMILAVMSSVVAVAAVIFIASPAFAEATESYARIALTGVVPVLAILAVSTAAGASSRVLNAQRGATLLGVLGAVATSVTYELWYAGVDGARVTAVALLIAAGAAVLLYGGAFAVLLAPALRSLPSALTVLVAGLVVVFGGGIAVLYVFPVVSTVLVAAAAIATVALMRRAEHGRTRLASA